MGFSPAAVVWHHRRSSIGAYWKQQKGYACAESLLAEKWPNQYNGAGHLTWSGRLYGKGIVDSFLNRSKIYHGTWGSSLFQSIYEPAQGILLSLPLMPEWYFVVVVFGALALLGLTWSPLLIFLPVFLLALTASLVQAGVSAAKQPLAPQTLTQRFASRILVAWLHLIQPLARLIGRIRHGVAPWQWSSWLVQPALLGRKHSIWSEEWQPIEKRLSDVENILAHKREAIRRGGDFDRWDLEVRGGLLGYIRALGVIEEHGSGKQLFRLKAWPSFPRPVIVVTIILSLVAAYAAYDQAWLAAIALAAGAVGIALIARAECAIAMKVWRDMVDEYAEAQKPSA